MVAHFSIQICDDLYRDVNPFDFPKKILAVFVEIIFNPKLDNKAHLERSRRKIVDRKPRGDPETENCFSGLVACPASEAIFIFNILNLRMYFKIIYLFFRSNDETYVGS